MADDASQKGPEASVAAALTEKFTELRRYREVVDVIPTPTLLADEAGGVTHANQAYLKLFGVDMLDVLGGGWRRLVRSDDLDRVALLWQRVVSEGALEWSSSAEFRVGGDEFGGYVMCTFKCVRLSCGGYAAFIYPACANPINCPVHSVILPKLQRGSQ